MILQCESLFKNAVLSQSPRAIPWLPTHDETRRGGGSGGNTGDTDLLHGGAMKSNGQGRGDNASEGPAFPATTSTVGNRICHTNFPAECRPSPVPEHSILRHHSHGAPVSQDGGCAGDGNSGVEKWKGGGVSEETQGKPVRLQRYDDGPLRILISTMKRPPLGAASRSFLNSNAYATSVCLAEGFARV